MATAAAGIWGKVDGGGKAVGQAGADLGPLSL